MISSKYSIKHILEFGWERRALLREVIPDIQQFAFHMGVDIEFINPVTINDESELCSDIINILQRPYSYVLVFFSI